MMPREHKCTTAKFRLPHSLVKSLDYVARRRGLRRNRLVASILADYVGEYLGNRFELFSVLRDRINILDKFLGEIVSVRLRYGELYCEYCRSYSCGHIRYAKRHRARLREANYDLLE